MEQLTKNQAVATSQEAVQNQNEPQLRDENAHNDKSVHGRSEERFSRNAETDLVCRLLLEKKKKNGLAELRDELQKLEDGRGGDQTAEEAATEANQEVVI